jgi:hypothetical protein
VQTLEPEVTTRSNKCKDITIDPTKRTDGLEKVVWPLKALVCDRDNAGKDEVTVYVDDIRFEVGKLAKELARLPVCDRGPSDGEQALPEERLRSPCSWRRMAMTKRMRLIVAGGLLCAFGLLAEPNAGFSQEKGLVPRVWIYKNVPGPEDKDARKQPELYFAPFFYFPETKASRIIVNVSKPVSDLDPDEKGTCIEFVFFDLGADDYAGAGFVPEGTLKTSKAPLNIAKDLLVGFNRPVYLNLRARTKAKQIVKVRFECGGLAVGTLVDGVRPAQLPVPEVTVLNDKWKDVTIDLTKKAAGLEKVACPLKVIVRANENPGKDEITVYVDDIRFEVGLMQNKK